MFLVESAVSFEHASKVIRQSIRDETDVQLPRGSEYEMKVRLCAALVTSKESDSRTEAERERKSVKGEGLIGQTS